MPLHLDWQKLVEISSRKRDAQESHNKLDRKVEAEALARQETASQWGIRKVATEFLKQHGYTSGGRKIGARKVPGL